MNETDPFDPFEEDDSKLHEALIEELIERQPALAMVRRFADGAARVSWFARLGDPLSALDMEVARAYLEALGFGHAEAARVGTWEDAIAAAESLGWDSEGWATEESLRAGLTAQVLETLSPEEFGVVQSFVASTVAPQIKAAADEVARLSDLHDPQILTAAIGAGLQATHGAVLVLLAGEEDHPFTARYNLFALGRWPMGVAGMTLNVF
ncbi:hypothetical protein JYU02_00780 [bacterium AH-315-P15]|nr:hypothetical protein [bacterium AH-315-P15]